MKTQTSKEVQEHIERFEVDIKRKDDALLEKKYMALRSGSTYQADYFQQQRDKLAVYHQTGMMYLTKRLEATREREEQEAVKQEAIRVKQELDAAKHEAQMKKTAFAKWIQSGGAPSDFEAAWTVLYQQMLQTQTIQKMVQLPSKRLTF